jgi:hypothetical protein
MDFMTGPGVVQQRIESLRYPYQGLGQHLLSCKALREPGC